MEERHFDDDEAESINKIIVPVKFAGVLTAQFDGKPTPEEIAVVQLDTSTRPDVADLARVAKREGLTRGQNPPFLYTTEKGHTGLLTRLTITDPVECEFAFFLPWPQHDILFKVMMSRDSFYLTAGELNDVLRNSLGVTVNSNDLSIAMDRWRNTQNP